jgi:hypothetical protein
VPYERETESNRKSPFIRDGVYGVLVFIRSTSFVIDPRLGTGIRRPKMNKVDSRGINFCGAHLCSFFRSLLVQLFVMRFHALSVYSAVGLAVSTAAMPAGSPPCHDDSKVMPYKALLYLSPPPQKSLTEKHEEKPYSPPPSPPKAYAVPLSPTPAPKVERPKPDEKSYLPAPAPKPYPENQRAEEKPYTTPPPAPPSPQKQESPKLEYPLAPSMKPYFEKPKAEEKPYAVPPPRKEEKPYAAAPPPPSPKEEETKSVENICPRSLALKPYPERSKTEEKPKSGEKLYAAPSPPPPPPPASKEGKYKRQDKSYSPLPPSPPPPYSRPSPEMTKSEAKPKPWAKTKPEDKPKPDVKFRPQKQPSLEEKGKSHTKQRPQDHKAKVIQSRH